MARTEFELNGRQVAVELPDGTPLLWALRDVLGLTGTKYGCGRGLCGACTVHVDGRDSRSCTTSCEQVAGREVTTIEGLAATAAGARGSGAPPTGATGAAPPATAPDLPTAALHPVQRAWLEECVVQCGYCQSGQIMAAAALLARTPKPTDADIDAAMGGVLCRCGTYQRIRAAIHRAAGS